MIFDIISDNRLSKLVRDRGIYKSDTLFNYISQLPYGRNQSRIDFSLVLKNKKGTCSSKHALIKSIAEENNCKELELIIGIYKMNHHNTPKIGDELLKNGLDYVPEAHCYLKYKEQRIDVTTHSASFSKIENDILEEKSIKPEQVGGFKIEYHQSFLEKWIKKERIQYGFNEIWEIREQCIVNLSS